MKIILYVIFSCIVYITLYARFLKELIQFLHLTTEILLFSRTAFYALVCSSTCIRVMPVLLYLTAMLSLYSRYKPLPNALAMKKYTPQWNSIRDITWASKKSSYLESSYIL